MRVAGQLTSAFDAAQLHLQIEGRNIDVKATRQAALALAGENDGVRGIFEVLKGGTVPQITLTARGESLNGLANMETLDIRGQMRAGDIVIPGVQLDLTDTDGDVVISGGILEGKNLRARLGNSIGHNGTLTLGLAGGDAPFHLDIDVRADLAQLPPILGRLIDNKDLRSELAKIKDLKGSANGKLVLGEKLGKVSVTVAAADMRLNARYGGIEQPVTITGGNFSYAGTRIAIGQLSGSLGKSTFSGLSGGFDWGKAGELEIASGRCRLYLAEVVPWLAAVDALHQASTYYGGEKGIITISAISVKGPLQTPRAWHFDLLGEVEDLVLKDLPNQPGPLTIAALTFKADPGELAYTDGRFSMLDAAVRMAGTHRDYRTGLDQDVSLTLDGRLGPEFIAWSAGLLGVPAWLKFQPLSLAPSSIRYVRNGKNTLSAAVVTRDGLEMSTDMLIGQDELIARKLLIQDNLSRAAIGLQVKDSAVELSFDGELHRQTLDRLFRENTLVAGSITGEGRARWDTQHLSRIGLQGELRGRDILVAYDPAAPLQISSLAMRGDMSKIWIDAADLNWGGMPLKMSGRLQPESDNRLGLELDIAADAVDLDHLIQVLQSDSDDEEPDTDPVSEPFPVIGTIRFAADRLTFGDFTWRPVHADVRLNGEHTDITIRQAVVCGIATPGTVWLSPETIRFDLNPTATDQDLNASLNCFAAAESAIKDTGIETIKSYKADGTYSLQGSFQGNGKPLDLLKNATGQMEFSAVDGHIYKSVVLVNVLKYLNATELLTGRTDLAEMEKKGFGYRTMKIEADLNNGKISFNRVTLDGAAMALTAAGEYDLMTDRLNLNLLVSLQITLDRIFGKIPLVGGALQTLTAVPLGVKGRLNDIRVFPLAPAAVSYQLKSLMEQTAKRPIRLIQIGKKPAAEGSATP
ncbi:MAG: AsmA-like C-terminal region-containing protein [Deltaproteobacteria bacterium]|nr:AsmA-like C-terminal region-containing protein [Deltaproteobacteria bacterium]